MRDVKRIELILAKLQKIWERYPDLRLGQLIANIVEEPYLYYIEDKELIETLEDYYMKESVN